MNYAFAAAIGIVGWLVILGVIWLLLYGHGEVRAP